MRSVYTTFLIYILWKLFFYTGSINLDRSGCSSSNSADGRRESGSRAASPWNSSASFSEQSEAEETTAELTVSNLPPYEPPVLQVQSFE